MGGFLVWFLWVQVEPLGAGLMNIITMPMAEDSAIRAHLLRRGLYAVTDHGVFLLVMLRFSPKGLIPESKDFELLRNPSKRVGRWPRVFLSIFQKMKADIGYAPKAQACFAKSVIAAQSRASIRFWGATQLPPTHSVFERARYVGADAGVMPPVGQNLT